jgi:hypothetical protein
MREPCACLPACCLMMLSHRGLAYCWSYIPQSASHAAANPIMRPRRCSIQVCKGTASWHGCWADIPVSHQLCHACVPCMCITCCTMAAHCSCKGTWCPVAVPDTLPCSWLPLSPLTSLCVQPSRAVAASRRSRSSAQTCQPQPKVSESSVGKTCSGQVSSAAQPCRQTQVDMHLSPFRCGRPLSHCCRGGSSADLPTQT